MSWFVYIRNFKMHILFCNYNQMFWLWSHTKITEFRSCDCLAQAKEYKHFYNGGF